MPQDPRELTRSLILVGPILGGLVALPAAKADTYVCELVAPSSASSVGQVNLPLSGTFIGNYDAATNPGGTQTRPGLSGGSGNNPISYTSTIVADAGFSASPTGSFTMAITPFAGTITGLAMDLTGGAAQELGVTFNINYQTFRTINPSSAYLGGFTIPIPIMGGVITAATVTQTSTAMVMFGSPDMEGTPFMSVVPVDIALEGEVMGTPLGGAPQPGLFALAGRITGSGASITVTSTVTVDEQSVSLPALPAVEGQPFSLPTVLPPGGTANLLLSGAFGKSTITTGLSVALVAEGTRQVSADINGDGNVNAQDLAALLAAWGTDDASADLDGNGTVGGVDLATLLASWS